MVMWLCQRGVAKMHNGNVVVVGNAVGIVCDDEVDV